MRNGGRLGASLALALLATSACVAGEARAPSPFEGLRACGSGGFALPGSSGCIRLSGSVTAATTLRLSGDPGARAVRAAPFGTRVGGRAAVDVRIPTEIGPLRAYTSLRTRGP